MQQQSQERKGWAERLAEAEERGFFKQKDIVRARSKKTDLPSEVDVPKDTKGLPLDDQLCRLNELFYYALLRNRIDLAKEHYAHFIKRVKEIINSDETQKSKKKGLLLSLVNKLT